MKEVQVKIYYPDELSGGSILVHQCAGLLENETIILKGKKDGTSAIVSHDYNNGLIYFIVETSPLEFFINCNKLEMVLEKLEIPLNYTVITAKPNFENIFVSKEDDLSVKLSLMEDKENNNVYWEDEICILKKKIDRGFILKYYDSPTK